MRAAATAAAVAAALGVAIAVATSCTGRDSACAPRTPLLPPYPPAIPAPPPPPPPRKLAGAPLVAVPSSGLVVPPRPPPEPPAPLPPVCCAEAGAAKAISASTSMLAVRCRRARRRAGDVAGVGRRCVARSKVSAGQVTSKGDRIIRGIPAFPPTPLSAFQSCRRSPARSVRNEGCQVRLVRSSQGHPRVTDAHSRTNTVSPRFSDSPGRYNATERLAPDGAIL